MEVDQIETDALEWLIVVLLLYYTYYYYYYVLLLRMIAVPFCVFSEYFSEKYI